MYLHKHSDKRLTIEKMTTNQTWHENEFHYLSSSALWC